MLDVVNSLGELGFILLFMIILNIILAIIFYKNKESKVKKIEDLLEVNKAKEIKCEKLIEQVKKLETDKMSTKINNLKEIDEYLYKRLNTAYDNFLMISILPVLNEFSGITVDTRKKLRESFIEKFEFLLTPEEKLLFEERFPNFEIFKFIIVEFFNIKTTKVELLVINKYEIREDEFRDLKLINSVFEGLSKSEAKEISKILDNINTK